MKTPEQIISLLYSEKEYYLLLNQYFLDKTIEESFAYFIEKHYDEMSDEVKESIPELIYDFADVPFVTKKILPYSNTESNLDFIKKNKTLLLEDDEYYNIINSEEVISELSDIKAKFIEYDDRIIKIVDEKITRQFRMLITSHHRAEKYECKSHRFPVVAILNYEIGDSIVITSIDINLFSSQEKYIQERLILNFLYKYKDFTILSNVNIDEIKERFNHSNILM